jgi:hypothetical protein
MRNSTILLLALIPITLVALLAVKGIGDSINQSNPVRDVIMYPASIPVDLGLQEKVREILARSSNQRNTFNYAITNVDGAVVSVIGLPDGLRDGTYTIDDATWLGTVDVRNIINPVQEVSPASVAPSFDYGGSGNILPFASGSTAQYGTLGVHDCGYSLTGWKAVDIFPSSNQVYASQEGDVSYVCRDSTQVSIRVGDFLYAHLKDTGQSVGDSYSQGQAMGELVTGSFNNTCGYAAQQAGKAHVHFCFIPNPSSGSFTADGYVLNTTTSEWMKGSSIVKPGGNLTASWVDAGGNPSSGSMFNFWDRIIGGIVTINNWAVTTFFLPPGTTQATLYRTIDWAGFFASGVGSVIELTGAALSTFNWWIPGTCILIDCSLFAVQLTITIYQFILGLIKKIPFL